MLFVPKLFGFIRLPIFSFKQSLCLWFVTNELDISAIKPGQPSFDACGIKFNYTLVSGGGTAVRQRPEVFHSTAGIAERSQQLQFAVSHGVVPAEYVLSQCKSNNFVARTFWPFENRNSLAACSPGFGNNDLIRMRTTTDIQT